MVEPGCNLAPEPLFLRTTHLDQSFQNVSGFFRQAYITGKVQKINHQGWKVSSMFNTKKKQKDFKVNS